MSDSNQDNQTPSQEEEKQAAPAASSTPGRSDSRGGDRNAAKAFYRAMYAGAEPDPQDFGMKVDKEEEYAARERAATEALAKRMEAEVAELEKKASDAESLYKRLAADFENYRKRMAREREEFQALGIQKAIETMLPALDDMDLAKANLGKTSDPKAMLDSLNMVYNRFTKCLEQIGIKQLDVIGAQFDPKFHEPVQQVVTSEVPDGAVFQQLRPGYVYGDKVLRPSLVNVATAPPEGMEPVADEVQAQAEEQAVEYEQEQPVYEEQIEQGEQVQYEEAPAEEYVEQEVAVESQDEAQVNHSSTQDIVPYEEGEAEAAVEAAVEVDASEGEEIFGDISAEDNPQVVESVSNKSASAPPADE